MNFIVENIWYILFGLAAISAISNSVVCILVLLGKKFAFSCRYMFTEYVMLLCVIFVMLKKIISENIVIIIFSACIALWCLMQLRLKTKKIVFIRVYGIHKKMHDRLSNYLNACAEYNHTDRTSMYIYGGDTTIPCNLIIFRGVGGNIIKNVLSEVNKFLKQYATTSAAHEIFQLFLNVAVIFIMLGGIM